MSFIGKIIGVFMERGAKNLSFAELKQKLVESGHEIETQLDTAPDTPKNREQLNHIVGIERWGQRRLRMVLGDSPVADEYDGYRLPEVSTFDALREGFKTTRAETVALVDELQQMGIPTRAIVPHNDIGDFTVGGWLYYLNGHANRESTRIK